MESTTYCIGERFNVEESVATYSSLKVEKNFFFSKIMNKKKEPYDVSDEIPNP